MTEWFFQGWSDLLRLLVVGTAAYLSLVAMLRLSGKRTLSKLNAFDLVVTVALGSTLATIIMSKDISLAEGLAALGLLIGLQFVVAWSLRRYDRLERVVKSEPTLLVRRGDLLHGAMRSERITAEEVEAAVRSAGLRDTAQAEAVVLESDGSLSVITG